MPEAAQDPSKRLEIRKYPNRRYYDTTRSRHVTLEEIYQLIREGYEIQVSDSKSGQDITAKVLAQIIIELDAPKLGVFPVSLLHRLLRSNEVLVNDFIQKYFNQPLAAFLDSQRSFEQYLRQAMGIQSPSPTMADWTKMMWGQFNNLSNPWARPAEPPSPPPAPAPASTTSPAETQELRDVVEQLRQEIAELRGQRGSGGKKKSGKSRRY